MSLTGDRNDQFGVYASDCCGSEIVIGPGSVFPTCPKHTTLTNWVNLQNQEKQDPEQEQKAA